ncbi:Proteinase inhibitor propeptide [Penicillium citrinum]|uniref:Proteinase inhibitor propeptide n=1 Tax=Penicillium citrinum TaxID=5077 RepID=A0A9W9TFL1_PENCI|nr:Proteinase inhibitor propeptide [Penicillium citrinum]KAJ5220893.1 Proteinase inhibitor propeptide [Penicillium citrinum]
MKLLFVLLGFLSLALATQSLKSVIITFPKGTPSKNIDEAKASIVKSVLDALPSGGVITHEYHLIKYDSPIISNLWKIYWIQTNSASSGFAAEVPTNTLETLSAESSEYKPTIEADQVVSANGN